MASQHVETLFRGGPSTALESVDPEQNQMRTPAYCSSTGPACYCLILTTDAKCIKSKSHLKHCPGQLQVPTSATSYLDTASRDDRQCEMSSTKCQCQATAAQRIGIAFTKLLQSISHYLALVLVEFIYLEDLKPDKPTIVCATLSRSGRAIGLSALLSQGVWKKLFFYRHKNSYP